MDYTSTAGFFGVIALLLAVGLTWHRQQYAGLVRWIIPAGAAGVTGHLLLGLVV